MIGLAKSEYNRAGQLVAFIVESLTVLDDRLGAWRRANAALTVSRPESVESIVCASSFLDMSSEHRAVLTHPGRRMAQLEQLAAHLRDTALPWFAGSADPRCVAQAVPDALLTPWGFAQDLMEFLVTVGQTAEARAVWARVRDLHPNHQHAFMAGHDMTRSDDRPRLHTPQAVGWSASVLGLL
ncbi:hypothetical protein AB0D59_44590 [Streptomyces sp. NPDC048417]|uniref:hypothetical protein n=1 Tax=Streptomyces sp. NPDC048417 TaxID=3155387 RepID=UPI00341C7781